MTRTGLFVLATVMLFSTAVLSNAFCDVRREAAERRPYVTEIGEPYSINTATLQREADKISELQEYLSLYGHPDYVEIQEIAPEWPWESYEVRLYYMQRSLEVAFGHVLFSTAMPSLGVLKFQGEIPPEKRHQIEVILQARVAPPAPPGVEKSAPPVAAVPPAPPVAAVAATEQAPTGGLTEAIVARLEAAAERAAQAADRAAEQSEAAIRAADRTVSIVEKIEQSIVAPGARPRR